MSTGLPVEWVWIGVLAFALATGAAVATTAALQGIDTPVFGKLALPKPLDQQPQEADGH
jgi:hypothetical protein